jgi:hypothetical protein
LLAALGLLAAAGACAPDESSVGAVLRSEPGLMAAYFDGLDFQRPSGVYLDANIDFQGNELNQTVESRGHVPATVSIRWTGQIWLAQPETYTVYFELRGRVRLWVDESLIIDDWLDSGALREARGVVPAPGGGWRNLRVDWDQLAGPMTARLSYGSDSQPKAVVPAAGLRHLEP